MDKTLISGKDKEHESDTSTEVQPHDMEKSKINSISSTAKSDETEVDLTERLGPDASPENGDNLCTVCGFFAKCPRSLKIHYARKHRRTSKNTNRTAKPNGNVFDTSKTEIEKEEEVGTERPAELKQNLQSGIDDPSLAPNGTGMNTSSTEKETVLDKQQPNQEEAVQTQKRRVSKRTPKPKIIHSCNYCGQEFWGKSPLDLHIQRYHTKDTPYTCEYALFPV